MSASPGEIFPGEVCFSICSKYVPPVFKPVCICIYKNQRTMKKRRRFKISAFQVIILSFLALILVGTGLLMLPFAAKSRSSVGFADALFTATSATCVTGLIVRDTATTWSVFGKAVLIILIQIGGLGVITVSLLFSMLLKKKIGLGQRSLMQESISASQVGGIVRMTSFIIKTVIVVETLGAVLLAPAFIKEFGVLKGIIYAFFHSISAFCNAGFDLMGSKEAFSSMTYFRGNILVNVVLILLILIGGLGFRTWDDIRTNQHHLKRYSMQSKVILSFSAVLLLIPFVYFFFAEYADLPVKERILSAAFQTAAPRTAGFNTTDLSQMSGAGTAMMIMLMLIGGASGSTAGGMKINTFAVLLITAWSVFRQRKDPSAFDRRIDHESAAKASTIFILYILLFVTAAMVISRIESLPLRDCLFETASAVATVGLTLGITPGLGMVSRGILVVLMFLGRVGGLTLIFAALSDNKGRYGRLPEENISIG